MSTNTTQTDTTDTATETLRTRLNAVTPNNVRLRVTDSRKHNTDEPLADALLEKVEMVVSQDLANTPFTKLSAELKSDHTAESSQKVLLTPLFSKHASYGTPNVPTSLLQRINRDPNMTVQHIQPSGFDADDDPRNDELRQAITVAVLDGSLELGGETYRPGDDVTYNDPFENEPIVYRVAWVEPERGKLVGRRTRSTEQTFTTDDLTET